MAKRKPRAEDRSVSHETRDVVESSIANDARGHDTGDAARRDERREEFDPTSQRDEKGEVM